MYKTIITVEILSEDSLEGFDGDLECVNNEITNGDWSGRVVVGSSELVDDETMAKLLISQGSDPGFFGLEVPEE